MRLVKSSLILFALAIATTALAQEEKTTKTPEERARHRTEKMAESLSLTQDQKDKVAALNLSTAQRNAAIRQDESMSKEKKREEFKANMQGHRAQLNQLLTAEQQAQLKAQRHPSPEKAAEMRTERMAKKLSLTAEQKARVATLNADAARKNSATHEDASLTKEQKKEAFKSPRV